MTVREDLGRPAASASMIVMFVTRCSYARSASVSRTTWLTSTIARVVCRLRAKVSRLRTMRAARSDSRKDRLESAADRLLEPRSLLAAALPS